MRRFSAFISYSHLDAAFARKLHRRLEAYRLPRRLTSDRVDARRHLKPIFRDHDELAAAPDLSGAVKAALAESEYLIVICSSHAEASAWVAREVSVFRELHGEHAVLAVLVDGCDDLCFRRLLCGSELDGRSVEPVAADFRRDGDGKSLAFLKLVSVLADVRLAALVQRDAQRRIRQITMIGASAFAAVVASASLAVMTVEARAKAELEHDRSLAFLRQQDSDVRKKCIELGQTDLCTRLDQSAKAYFSSEDVTELSVADQEEYAKILQSIGQDDETIGELDDATRQYADAYRITKQLLELNDADIDRIYSQAQSEFWVGKNAWVLEKYQLAEQSYNAYAKMADRLAQADPNKAEYRIEQGYANTALGTFFLRRKIDTVRAESYFSAAVAAFRAAETIHPADADQKREIAEIYGWRGDAERVRGDYKAAFDDRTMQRQIFLGLQQKNPKSADLKAALAYNDLALARIDVCQHRPDLALERLKVAHDDVAMLADNDKNNADLRRQVRILELFEVTAWLSQPRAARPSDDIIAHTLGDCSAEVALRNNDELATYCFIIKAHQSILRGDVDGKNASLKAAQAIPMSHIDGLSPRWGLNFKQEMALISQMQTGPEKQQ